MAYRATPQCTAKYSAYYLLRGEKIYLSGQDLRAELPQETQNSELAQKLENLESSLRKAYEAVK
jgi:hypothetical protein